MSTTSVILAAGFGTRMRSKLPKVLHPIGGHPMIWHALQAVKTATGKPPVVVIGHGAEDVREAVGENATFTIQEEQLGTGHALQQAESLLRNKTKYVLVTSADLPLLTSQTFLNLIDEHKKQPGPITLLTAILEDARGFGQVVRGSDGQVQAIVEQAQATPDQLNIRELNVGAYCFDAKWLWDALKRIPISSKGEYYLTDLVGIAVEHGLAVKAQTLSDVSESIGINTRVHLAEAEEALRQRINRDFMLSGVTIVDPKTTYIDAGVSIGQDTTIWPNTLLQGETFIGKECTLGPNTVVRHSKMGAGCRVLASVIEHAVIENNVNIGPFGHLRKGSHLADGVHMGNFGEVKNSHLGPGVKMGHFSYIGDATIGQDVNIGAGTITCNYDGKDKHHTHIEAGAFIGSDTMLVAPIKVGKAARTGAGSVVTKDVPDKTVVAGIPARAIRKLDNSD
ncbi:MAG: UDP-N-acetylglucosamine diphosphorylase/glucosamine-1-phosphate N-acetyltransferase [Chloroflexi bacterium]|nr:UDP-N-acetylglucosamine diphosphorylase/glucosamine-1-phosphate N-acetyltransferase [Chloroflexota bacterium]